MLDDLTALSRTIDPYRLGSPEDWSRIAEWIVEQVEMRSPAGRGASIFAACITRSSRPATCGSRMAKSTGIRIEDYRWLHRCVGALAG